MTRIDDTPVLWHLHKNSSRLTCAVRLTPAGLQLEQIVDERRLVAMTFQSADELYAQAEVVRREWLEMGWTER